MREYTMQDAERAAKGYVMYLRKSREDIEAEKRGEMETLARHERMLRALADEQEINVVKVYKEVVSGETIQDRPEMQQMMQEVYAGKYAGVVCVKPDRLSRGDLENMGYIMNGLKFSGTQLVTPGKTYDVLNNKFDEQMLEMQLFNSKQEYRSIVARMQEGKMLSIREGNYMGSIPPYGYDITSPDRWTRTLVPNDDAEMVVRIFEWYVNDRLTTGEISRKLFNMGIPTRTGNLEWNKTTIVDILKNIVYTGKIRWFRRKSTRELDENGNIMKKKRRRSSEKYLIVQGKHQALISDEMFEAAQELFCGSVPKKVGTVIVNPLAGLLKCSECGRIMCFQQFKKQGTPPRFVHPDCKTHRVKSSFATDVMALLCQTLKEYVAEFEFKVTSAGRTEAIERHTSDVAHLERELEKAKAKRRKLFDDYENDIYTPAEFKERKAVWAERIESMAEELEHLMQQKPAEVDYNERVVKFSKVINAIENPETPAKEINELLKEIISHIDYYCEDLGHRQGGKITLDVTLKK